MLQPDLGTTLVIAQRSFMLIAVELKIWHMAGLGFAELVCLWLQLSLNPIECAAAICLSRSLGRPSGKGHRTIQSFGFRPRRSIRVGSGASLRQKFLYLPENHTDFIFMMIEKSLALSSHW